MPSLSHDDYRALASAPLQLITAVERLRDDSVREMLVVSVVDLPQAQAKARVYDTLVKLLKEDALAALRRFDQNKPT